MKWFHYVAIVFRFLLFWFIYHVIISLSVGMLIGLILIIPEVGTNADDVTLAVLQHIRLFVTIGVISLIISATLSGWQHFRYFKRKKHEYLQISDSD